MKARILKLINAKVTLPTYLWVCSSLFLAFYLYFHADLFHLTPFAHHLPIDSDLWLSLLILGDITCLVGMVVRSAKLPIVRAGAFLSFSCWLFGNIALLATGGWLLVVWVTMWYNLMYAYLYLGASLGVFARKPKKTTLPL